ncbi:hypothetical protein HK102_001141, partial [Quaeritorhiza haematococci]
MITEEIVKFTYRPSHPNSLAWSEDNQIVVVTPTAVHILTPKCFGSTLDRTSLFKRTSINVKHSEGKKFKFHSFERPVNDPDVRPADILKEGFRSVAWSPTGFSALSGCLLATISTSHCVSVYEPSDDPATSEWKKIADLSDLLYSQYNFTEEEIMVSKSNLDKLESISIAWSGPCRLKASVKPVSLIAVGSKEGTVALFSYVNKPAICATFRPHETWVTDLEWSDWFVDENGLPYAYLSSAGADGSVYVWVVQLTRWSISGGGTGIKLACNVTLRKVISQPELPVALAMRFYTDPTRTSPPKCAVAKGSRVYVWYAPHSILVPTPEHVVDLTVYKMSVTMGVGGLTWSTSGNGLRVFTLDGKSTRLTFHNGTLVLGEDMTANLHQKIFQNSAQWVNGADDDEDGGDDDGSAAAGGGDDGAGGPIGASSKQLRIYGSAGSWNGLVDALLYRISSSFDMEYKTAKSDVAFMSFQAAFKQGDQELEQELIYTFKQLLARSDLLDRWTPSYLLWDLIEYCENESGTWNDIANANAANSVTGGSSSNGANNQQQESFFMKLMNALREFYITYDGGGMKVAEPNLENVTDPQV